MNFNVKKIAFAIALATASSFAAWDYYNIPEEHHGEARVRAHYWYNGDFHSTDLNSITLSNLVLRRLRAGFLQAS